MPKLLSIPDSAFQDAASAIAKVRLVNDPNVDATDIEDELRSYVDLGINKQIVDWAVSLDDDTKAAIANSVTAHTTDLFHWTPEYKKVFVDLDALMTQAAIGNASVRIAYPRAAQEQYEQQQLQGFQAPGIGQTILQAIQGLFQGVGTTAQAALRGLGIDIPIGTILLIIVAVVAFVLFKRA